MAFAAYGGSLGKPIKNISSTRRGKSNKGCDTTGVFSALDEPFILGLGEHRISDRTRKQHNIKHKYPYHRYVYLCALEVWRLIHGPFLGSTKDTRSLPLIFFASSVMLGDTTVLGFVQGRDQTPNRRFPFSSNWLTKRESHIYTWVIWWRVTLAGTLKNDNTTKIRCVGVPDMMRRQGSTKAVTTFQGDMHVHGKPLERMNNFTRLFESTLAQMFPDPPPTHQTCPIQFDQAWMYWVWNCVSQSRQDLILREKEVIFRANYHDRVDHSKKTQHKMEQDPDNNDIRHFYFDEHLEDEENNFEEVDVTETDTISDEFRARTWAYWTEWCARVHELPPTAFAATPGMHVGHTYRIREWHEFTTTPYSDQLRLDDEGNLVGSRLPKMDRLQNYLVEHLAKTTSSEKKRGKKKKKRRREKNVHPQVKKRPRTNESQPPAQPPGSVQAGDPDIWRDAEGVFHATV